MKKALVFTNMVFLLLLFNMARMTMAADLFADDFSGGTQGTQPANWTDETDDSTLNAEIEYGYIDGYVYVTTVAAETVGRVNRNNSSFHVDVFDTLEVVVSSFAGSGDFQIGMYETGPYAEHLGAAISSAGTHTFDIPSGTGLSGTQTLGVVIVVNGLDTVVEIDSVRVYGADTPTFTHTYTFTETPIQTATGTPTQIATPTPTDTCTPEETFTASPSPTFSATSTPVFTGTSTSTPTYTVTPTYSATATDTPTSTPTSTGIATSTITPTTTRTPTASASSTASPTYTATPTETVTLTRSATNTASATFTHTPTQSQTMPATPTATPTRTITPTSTFSCTYTATPSITPTYTVTPSITVSNTPSPTLTISPTITASPTITLTQSPTTTAAPAQNLEAVIVFPNPFIERQAVFNRISFIRLTYQANIKVYTITGDLVWEAEKNDGSDRLIWQGMRNTAGDRVASGIYIYIITNDTGERRTGKLAILR